MRGWQATPARLSEGVQGAALHWKKGPAQAGVGRRGDVGRLKKRYKRRRVVGVVREVVRGGKAAVISWVIGTQRSMGALINTAYTERLNATFRARLAPLVRQTRAGATNSPHWRAGCGWLGSCYNFVF